MSNYMINKNEHDINAPNINVRSAPHITIEMALNENT